MADNFEVVRKYFLEITKDIQIEGLSGGTVKVYWDEIVVQYSIPSDIQEEVKHEVEMFVLGNNTPRNPNRTFKVKLKDKRGFFS